MPVFCAIVAAREATSWASGCGVVTTTASARGSSWPSEIETSPVPGGMSTTSTSSSPQWTSCRNCSSARCSIGPRHITGCVVVEEEADRHQLQVVRDRRHDHLVDDDGLLPDAEHVRDRVAVDVRVEHADLAAERGERRGEVDGQTSTCRRRPCPTRPRSRASQAGSWIAARLDAAAQLASSARRAPRASSRRTTSAHRRDARAGRRRARATCVLEARAQRAAGDGEHDRQPTRRRRRSRSPRTMSSSVTGRRSSGSMTRLERLQDLLVRRHHGRALDAS